ncbi:MAG: HAD-IA family hydrolase [Glaciimonas sp.]|nr:HAD-IA family hydrolase [Glaciimonas sp.]
MPLLKPSAILFDLDGTLADTAPDLAAAMTRMQSERGLTPTAYEHLRPVASAGARGLIGTAFGIKPGDDAYEDLRVTFLDYYAEAIAVKSRLFDGIPALLDNIELNHLRWGIVTNKASRFTNPLVPQIGLQNAGCIISGDTTPHAKPHPAPLLEAARRLNLSPAQCWYVGDDLRDIQAGRAAGMATIAITWGYGAQAGAWGADALVNTPAELYTLIQQSQIS